MKLAQIAKTALLNCRLTLDAPVVVGVSGGPDSLCLLDALARAGFPVIVAHFNHRLRSEAAQDADTVRRAAELLNLPFVLGSEDVRAYAEHEGLSLEDAARQMRYRFLFGQARLFAAQAVAVGHHADDQVETVLMHLLRGAGLTGLKGMTARVVLPEWDPTIPLVRPLLNFWREEILEYCRAHHIQPVFDATNQDETFFRNRLRSQLIPLLEQIQPGARQNIHRAAGVLAGDEAVIEEAVQQAWERCQAQASEDQVSMELARVRALPVGLQRRLLRRAASLVLGGLPDVDFAAVERAVRFVRARGSGQVDLVRGLRLFVEGRRLVVAGKDGPAPSQEWPRLDVPELAVPVPGTLDLGRDWRLLARLVRVDAAPLFTGDPVSEWQAWLDADSLPGDLWLRRPRPGDRFQPLGMDGHSLKLSDFWVNQKLPRRARAAWPLLMAGQMIAWVPGYRVAHPFRITEATRRVLHVQLLRSVA